MLVNIPTKTRIFLIMIVSQIGFAIISTIAILGDYKITAIIVVNIIFAIVVAYLSYNSIQRIAGGIDRIKSYLDDIMDFIFFKQIQ